MKSLDIRKRFIDFFVKHRHTHVPSSSLIPADDPTLLFANAGMNQFKDLFLGKEERSYQRAVSIQKCIRAGGKHNDLEQVGFTRRHLTFFEMMGNFSFGDYFKTDAIRFAWDFLTKELGMEATTLYASVYEKDDEAYQIWQSTIGLPTERIVRLGAADNFWQMGDTGPCGPCTEIYVDRGSSYGCGKQNCAPGCSCDRFLEVWNLVFMQFDRQPNGTDVPLARTGVDTGMGLERLCAVLQKKETPFDTDLFAPLITAIEQATGKHYATNDPLIKGAFRVLADHVRSVSFALADGCTPSNEGRGYVLRKIIRRAALFAQKLSSENFLPRVAEALIEHMGRLYPELITAREFIVAVLTSEIEKFSYNLVHGQELLRGYMKDSSSTRTITAVQAFKLYDTYGFPLELTQVIAQAEGFVVDSAGFEREMEAQRAKSGKKQVDQRATALDPALVTEFTGYDELVTTSSIIALLVDGVQVEAVPAGTRCEVVTARSPFYVECGGQISDQGTLNFEGISASLEKLRKLGGAISAELVAPCPLRVGMPVEQQVDRELRLATMKNHTATHLLQSALLMVVGPTIKQSGSLVTPDYLRFDFTHHENLSADQVRRIEELVTEKILENIPLSVANMSLAEATGKGVIAFFGEKYNPDKVRVVAVPGFSAELCGGTHVRATGDIGTFKITEVGSLSAGNRRIFAVTGKGALKKFQEDASIVKQLCTDYKVQPADLVAALTQQKDQLKHLRTQVTQLRRQSHKAQVPVWAAQVAPAGAGKVPFAYIMIPDASALELREIASDLIVHTKALFCLVTATDDRLQCVITAPAGLVDLKPLAEGLQRAGVKGGVSGTTFQGGAPVSVDLEKVIKALLVG